jgi:DNA mismatch endonuclease (patch repair protein)
MKQATPTNKPSAERSAQMARVKGRDTGPEMRVRRALHAAGLRYRLHDRHLPGKPDIILSSRAIAIFVHGCFWHRHSDPACKLARWPKSKLDFWVPKLEANRARDVRNEASLRAQSWDVRIIWECELGHDGALDRFVQACRDAPRVIRPKNRRDAPAPTG